MLKIMKDHNKRIMINRKCRLVAMLLLALFYSDVSVAIPTWIAGSQASQNDDNVVVSDQRLAQIRQNLAAGQSSVANLRALQNRLRGNTDNNTSTPATSSATTNDSAKAQTTARALNGDNQDMGGLVSNNNVSVKGLKSQAFSNVVSNALPMSPEQILKLHALFNKTQQAQATIPGVPAKPVTRMMQVNLSPGSTPPVIRIAPGFVSAISLLDATGAPWPIAAYDLGDPTAYNISWNQKNNILMVQGMTIGKVANIVVQLKGLSTPVLLTLVSSQQAVDYRVDLRVPMLGPNPLQTPGSTNLPATATPTLLGILNGVPPSGSKALEVDDEYSQAWFYHDKLYLRTRAQVLSPGWLASMNSGDGTRAYEMQKTPVVLLNKDGKTVPLKITGFE